MYNSTVHYVCAFVADQWYNLKCYHYIVHAVTVTTNDIASLSVTVSRKIIVTTRSINLPIVQVL